MKTIQAATRALQAFAIIAGVALSAASAARAEAPPVWTVDAGKSRIVFIGRQMGAASKGWFKKFSATIRFDPKNLGASSAEVTVDTAMDNLAREQDKVMARIARSKVQGDKGPLLNKERDESYWLNQPGSPKAKLANEKPQGETVNYDDLIKAWREGRVK